MPRSAAWLRLRTLDDSPRVARLLQPRLAMPSASPSAASVPTEILLPEPALTGRISLEEVIAKRRSARRYGRQRVSLAEIGQLLWATQGVTRADGRRAAPSAGALYPLSALLVAERVDDLAPGAYAYLPLERRLRLAVRGAVLSEVAAAALGQDWIGEAAAALAISAVYGKATARYGERGQRYAHLEAGLAAENAHLEATALGLRSVLVGAFDDAALARALELGSSERPLLLLIVGRSP